MPPNEQPVPSGWRIGTRSASGAVSPEHAGAVTAARKGCGAAARRNTGRRRIHISHKRARCERANFDLIDAQHASRDRPFAPSPQGRPERHPVGAAQQKRCGEPPALARGGKLRLHHTQSAITSLRRGEQLRQLYWHFFPQILRLNQIRV